MQSRSCVLLAVGWALLGAASTGAQSGGQPDRQTRLAPARIILVGDSTVAPRNGWGPGFCAIMAPEVKCLNLAKNGRSSGSYRAEGSWVTVMEALSHNSSFGATYVLIQFGHNDQPGKPGRSTDLSTEFPANMRGYVKDVLATGATPVLVTPLTRRLFRDGRLTNDLAPWGAATKKVASETGVAVLDLNSESAAAVQKMGAVEANTLAMAPAPPDVQATAASGNSLPVPKASPPVSAPAGTQANNLAEPKGDPAALFDYTHLGEKGSALFGRMVAGELMGAVPSLRPYINP